MLSTNRPTYIILAKYSVSSAPSCSLLINQPRSRAIHTCQYFSVRMALRVIAFSVSKNIVNNSHTATGSYPKFNIMVIRNLSSVEVTKNLSLITSEKKKPKVLSNLKLDKLEEKPLCVMLSWLMAKKKHIYKYADLYVQQGFDVLNVSINPWQLLWPTKGTQVVANDILKFLDVNTEHSPLILHGFSVGAYVWSEVLVKMASEMDRYQHVVDRVAGQIWDSAADITEIPIGLPIAVFPKNAVLQSALRQYIIYHMKTFDKVATCHYIRASQMFHTNFIKVPAQFMLSKTDPIGAIASNTRARESWENMGIPVYFKVWEKSPHVGHFRHHPQEYIQELGKFFEMANIQNQMKQKVQAKL